MPWSVGRGCQTHRMPSAADQTLFGEAVFTTRDQHHDAVRFEGTDFTGAHAEGHSFLECSLLGGTLDEAHLEGSRWSESEWQRVAGVGLSLVEASLVETTMEGCRLAAVSAWGSTWRDVTVRGGKVDFLNLRGARLKDVAFVDCVVVELDLQEATVDGLYLRGLHAGVADLRAREVCRPRPVRSHAAFAGGPGRRSRRDDEPRAGHRPRRRPRRRARHRRRRLSAGRREHAGPPGTCTSLLRGVQQ